MASSNASLRSFLISRLNDEGRGDLAQKLVKCSEVFQLTCTCCGKTKKIERGCKKRWCPVCAPKITAERVSRFAYAAGLLKWPLAVTLTGPNTQHVTGEIKKMRKALFAFRRTKLWGGNVNGGIVSFEVTNTGKGWHVHCHLLVDARWLAIRTRAPRTSDTKPIVRALCASAHRELSAAWAKCLGIPHAVTWAERAWGKALLETIKYNVKPAELLECEDDIGPLIDEMHRMQLVNGFGTCYGLTKKWRAEEKAKKQAAECDECGGRENWIPSDVIGYALHMGRKYI